MLINYLRNHEPTLCGNNYEPGTHAKMGVAALITAAALLAILVVSIAATAGVPLRGFSPAVAFLGKPTAILICVVTGILALFCIWRGMRHYLYYPTATKNEASIFRAPEIEILLPLQAPPSVPPPPPSMKKLPFVELYYALVIVKLWQSFSPRQDPLAFFAILFTILYGLSRCLFPQNRVAQQIG